MNKVDEYVMGKNLEKSAFSNFWNPFSGTALDAQASAQKAADEQAAKGKYDADAVDAARQRTQTEIERRNSGI